MPRNIRKDFAFAGEPKYVIIEQRDRREDEARFWRCLWCCAALSLVNRIAR